MDGIEWKRRQFGIIGKAWYWINEKIAILTADHLIGDHPKIVEHLHKFNFMKRPLHSELYSARIRENIIPLDLLSSKICSIVADQEFALIMAALEPDNQILEIIRAFSHERRDYILCCWPF